MDSFRPHAKSYDSKYDADISDIESMVLSRNNSNIGISDFIKQKKGNAINQKNELYLLIRRNLDKQKVESPKTPKYDPKMREKFFAYQKHLLKEQVENTDGLPKKSNKHDDLQTTPILKSLTTSSIPTSEIFSPDSSYNNISWGCEIQ